VKSLSLSGGGSLGGMCSEFSKLSEVDRWELRPTSMLRQLGGVWLPTLASASFLRKQATTTFIFGTLNRVAFKNATLDGLRHSRKPISMHRLNVATEFLQITFAREKLHWTREQITQEREPHLIEISGVEAHGNVG